MFGLSFLIILLVFKVRIIENHFIWPWLIAFGAIGNNVLLVGGVRLLRSLPLSSGRAALILLLMPLCSILTMSVAVGMIQYFNLVHLFDHYWVAFVIPCAGAGCIGSSLPIYFGKNGLPMGMGLTFLASIVIYETVLNVKWPDAFWWVLGLCLITAAFFLNRHWLRCSASYRPASGGFWGRQR